MILSQENFHFQKGKSLIKSTAVLKEQKHNLKKINEYKSFPLQCTTKQKYYATTMLTFTKTILNLQTEYKLNQHALEYCGGVSH